MIALTSLAAVLAAEPAPTWRTGLTAPVARFQSVTIREAMRIDDTIWAFTDLETELPLGSRPNGWGASIALRSTATAAVEDERTTFLVRQGSLSLVHGWAGRRERTVHAFGALVDMQFADARAWALSESDTGARFGFMYVGNIETNPVDIAYDVQLTVGSRSGPRARFDLAVIAPLSDRWALAVGWRGERAVGDVPWIAMAGIRQRPSDRIEWGVSAECVCDVYTYAADARILPDVYGTWRF